MPWKSSDTRLKRITKSTDIPSLVAQIRRYLKKFYVGKPNKETTIYPGVYIGHTSAFADMQEEIQDWLDSGNHAMFYMMLQAEESTEIG